MFLYWQLNEAITIIWLAKRLFLTKCSFFVCVLFRSLSNMPVVSNEINPWRALFYLCFLNCGKQSRSGEFHDSNIAKIMNECYR